MMILSSAITDNFGLRELALCAVLLIIVAYAKRLRDYMDYWKNQNVPYEEFSFFRGPISRIAREPFHEIDMKRLKKHGKIFGSFEGPTPTLVVADPDLVKLVLVKYFQELPDRRHVTLNDPILDNMMNLVGADRWRKLRPAASPAFSTGKLRKMNSIIHDCARITTQHLLQIAEEGKDFDPKEFFGHYTLDVIARSAFGARLESRSAQANEFVARLHTAFAIKPTFPLILILYAWILFPFMLKLHIFSPDTFLFLKNFCLNVIEERKQSSVKHQDFLQLMVDAQDRGLQGSAEGSQDAEDELCNLGTEQTVEKAVSTKALSKEEALSQCVSFFIAGQDATSSVLAYTFYLLAVNPDVQQRLREEVDGCFKVDVRFNEENVGSIRPYSYLPFGAGPRNCIGRRLALQALKLCLLHIVHSVELVRTENTRCYEAAIKLRGVKKSSKAAEVILEYWDSAWT
ncbi:hypothetical protein V5799_020053 [Amblyomma americanum]|uniref:Cytochrome n=1 Tax=Amblyomma americanum TaxID=6943 RepID=A0AAQ4EVW1_AMBAM